MNKYLISSILLLITVFSCSVKKSTPSYDLDFTLDGEIENLILAAHEGEKYDKLETKEGPIIEFRYDKTAPKGPILLEETARNKFNIIEHRSFFENRMIDPKVYKIFLDSVEIIDIQKISESDSLLYPCEACKTKLKIRFWGQEYDIPSSISEKVFEQDYSHVEKIGEGPFYYKYYKEDGQLNLSAIPVKNNFNNKKILHARCQDSQKCTQLLKSIRMN